MEKINININGKNFFVIKSHRSFWNDVNKGSWEPHTFRILDKFLDNNHSYIDIGSWIGPTVLYGSQIAKHTYAIEPDLIAYKILQTNINLNPNIKNKITLFNGCIANKNGNIRIGNRNEIGDSMSSIIFKDSKLSWNINSLTLERFIKTNKIKDCNFIKMDIEGGELIVLPSIHSYLQKIHPTLYLSLHPNIVKNYDFKIIHNVLRIYDNIMDSKGNKINLKDTAPKNLTDSIIATND